MRPSLQALVTVAIVAIAYFAGVTSQRDSPVSPSGFKPGFSDTSGRTKFDCAALSGPNTAVLLVMGQSNAGNHGKKGYVPAKPVFNFNPADGACYTAGEPLLGATGGGGSAWTRLGDRLIAAAWYDNVLIVPIAIGRTSVTEWAWGEGHARMVTAVFGLVSAGLSITHVLWHQGETDARSDMSSDAYARHLAVVIRSARALGVSAPVYVARATLCTNSPRNEDIRDAQHAITLRLDGVAAGPDTDTLAGPDMRFDGCHFTARGLDAHAQLWFEAIAEHR